MDASLASHLIADPLMKDSRISFGFHFSFFSQKFTLNYAFRHNIDLFFIRNVLVRIIQQWNQMCREEQAKPLLDKVMFKKCQKIDYEFFTILMNNEFNVKFVFCVL